MEAALELEVCPSCGGYGTLSFNSGWCADCVPEEFCSKCLVPLESPTENGECGACRKCRGCGHVFSNDANRAYCSTCRRNRWLLRNADKIEEFILRGFSVKKAIKEVQQGNLPKCRRCGDEVPGNYQGLFCTNKLECRRAYNRYRYYRSKGLAKENAIREALCFKGKGQYLRS